MIEYDKLVDIQEQQLGFIDNLPKMKNIFMLIIIILLAVGGAWFYSSKNKKVSAGVGDPKNAIYIIENRSVKLVNGYAETEAAPGSASKIITKYFGNELKTDLDGDGREDTAFIITQQGGGSGVFYYAVAALNKPEGYVGSDGYLLGDRIAPQSTILSTNPNHKNVVVFNFADRAPSEPMTANPSVGKSVYLKIGSDIRWGVVAPNFEGESR